MINHIKKMEYNPESFLLPDSAQHDDQKRSHLMNRIFFYLISPAIDLNFSDLSHLEERRR